MKYQNVKELGLITLITLIFDFLVPLIENAILDEIFHYRII